MSIETPFNINHEIIKYFISNKEKINRDQRLLKYFDELFQSTSRFTSNFHSSSSEMKDPTSEIDYLNSILKKINETLETQFILTEKDFPNWINQKIKWKL